MFKYLIIATLVAVATAGEMKFIDCGNQEVKKLFVDGCSGEFCQIKRGQKFHMQTEFVANQDTKNLKIEIFALVSGIKIPVPGIETNGCNHTKCPIAKGSKVVFTYDLIVPTDLPSAEKMIVTAALTGDNGKVACGSVKGKLI